MDSSDYPDHIARWNGSQYIDAGVYHASFFGAPHWALLCILVLLLIIFFISLLRRFVVVDGNEAVVFQRFGVPNPRPRRAGIHWVPFFTKVKQRIDLKQLLVELTIPIVTQDQVNGHVKGVVRYVVRDDDTAILNFVYKMDDPVTQLMRRVENEMRQIISGIPFLSLYGEAAGTIAHRIIEDQTSKALETGLQILDVTLEQPTTSDEVEMAMNNKMVAILRNEAAKAEGEAETTKRVAISRADKESKRLQGEGIANQRMAIMEGLRKSMSMLNSGDESASFNISEDHMMQLIMQTMHVDMVTSAAQSGKSTLVFVPVGTDVLRASNIAGLAGGTSLN